MFGLGFGLPMVDVFSGFFLTINNIPVFGVLGVALMTLVASSWLNWNFKEAWYERTTPRPPANSQPSPDG